MAVKYESSTDLNLLSCQACGQEIIAVPDGVTVFIPSLNWKCPCGVCGIFTGVVIDTTVDDKIQKKLRKDIDLGKSKK